MKYWLGVALLGVMSGLAIADQGPATQDKLQTSTSPLAYVRETQAGNFLAGQHAQREQDWSTASKYIGRVLDYDPTNAELKKRAMILAMGSGETARAIATARKIVATDSKDALALMFVTLDDFARQDYKGAVSNLSAMPDGSMAEFIRPILTSWAKAGQGQLDIGPLRGDSPLQAYHTLLIGDFLDKTDDDVEAQADKIIAQSAVDAYELEKIADILARHGKNKKALSFYQIILKEQPNNTSVAAKEKILKSGKPLDIPPAILTANDGAAEAMFDMGRILFREMSNDSAMVFTRMALHLNPRLIEARLLLAHVLGRADRHNEAIDVYLSIAPDSPYYRDARHAAADLLERSKKSDKAITTLETLYQQTGDVEAVIMIGDLQRRSEKFVDAIESYNRAEKILGGKIDDAHWHIHYARGMSYERAGQDDKSEIDLLAALKFRPDHPYLLNYLGYSWADQGKNLKKAREMIEKAVALRPDDGYIADSLGWVLYRMGDYKAALPHLEKAAELLPYDPTINDHLGDAYWQTGRALEARFQWSRALHHADNNTEVAAIQSKIDNGMPAAASGGDSALHEVKVAEPGDDTAPITPR